MGFVGLLMMPFHYGSKARSVPEYRKLRFAEKTRTFNAPPFAMMTAFSSGISMLALAKLLHAILGWNFAARIFISGATVLVFIYPGGLTSAIYNEVRQFFLIVPGFLPLVILDRQAIGSRDGLMHYTRCLQNPLIVILSRAKSSQLAGSTSIGIGES